MKNFTFCCYTFFSFALFIVIEGCATQGFTPKVVTAESKYPKAIEKAKKDKRYFILQSGINVYNVKSVDLDQAKEQMTVTLDKVDSVHLAHFKNPIFNGNETGTQIPVQPEIQVYLKDSTSYTMDEPHTIPVRNIARIELLGKS